MQPLASAAFRPALCALLLVAGGVPQSPPPMRSGAPGVAGSALRTGLERALATTLDAAGAPGSQATSTSDLVVTDPPIPLKWKQKTLGKASDSSIAVDAAGNPHVVFNKESKGGRVLTHAWAEGSHWFSEPVDAVSLVGYDNALAIDAAGGLHVAYAAAAIGGGWKLMYAHRADGAWQTETVDSGGLSNSIAIDGDGFVHVVHCDDFSMRYAKQTATGWETESVGSGVYFGGSSLLLRDGKAWATYSDASHKLCLAIRDGGAWSADVIDDGLGGSAAFDHDGMLHVVYSTESSGELRHAWLAAGGWQHETLISGTELFGGPLPANWTERGEFPALVADAAGRLELANGLYLTNGKGWTEALLVSAFDGVAWSPSLVGAKQIGFANSIAVDGNGIVHVSTGRAIGNSTSIVAVRLKGARLSLAVSPKAAGTIGVSPSGLQCTAKASTLLYPGTQVLLTAEPAAGFVFKGWSGAASGTDPNCPVTVNKACKVVARFKPAP